MFMLLCILHFYLREMYGGIAAPALVEIIVLTELSFLICCDLCYIRLNAFIHLRRADFTH